ncbi:H1 protein, partial [Upupa epops]|nr:H1 protein [Upupa epops]
SETAPAAVAEIAPAAAADPGSKIAAHKAKKAAAGSKAHRPNGPSVTELITKAGSTSKERKRLSFTALKKALAASGYDVEKNNNRIKQGLWSLVGKGTLVQTKGTGVSGSFCLSKKPREAKEKTPKRQVAATKPKSAAKKPASTAKKPKTEVTTKNPKKMKKPETKSPRKATKSVKGNNVALAAKSSARAKAVRPKVVKPKAAKAKKAALKK